MDIEEVNNRAIAFRSELAAKKSELAPPDFWYPYDIMSNIWALFNVLTGENRTVFDRFGDLPILDIGAADGDLAFFLESLGHKVQIVDYGPTNYNQLKGARLLRDGLGSSVEIHEVDLDSQFNLPGDRHSVAFFLGILYHLKNPYYALETLARKTRYCFISTRIAAFTPDKQTHVSQIPMAYLLDAGEANNDPTNYWIFSETGLRRILDRTGWDVLDFGKLGNTADSDPVTSDGDERAFCLLESRAMR